MRARTILTVALAFGIGIGIGMLGAGAVHAQTAAPREGDSPKLNEAQRRFHRGIDLYKNGEFAAAQVEFTRAYELVPNYKILYNLGQVSYQRHDHAAALRFFRQYLTDGDDEISAERRHEVSGDITDLEQRIGRLQIDAGEDGAEVFIDDVLIGKTPLRALIVVNGGPRKVDMVARNGEHQSRQIDVGSGEIVRVPFPRLTLAAPPDVAGPARPAARPRRVTASADTSSQTAASLVAKPSPPRADSAGVPWKSWTLTGLLAAGAAATGTFALTSKRELDDQLKQFPTDDIEIDYYKRRTRGFALATDGLLIGTAVMTAVSLYLTFRDPK